MMYEKNTEKANMMESKPNFAYFGTPYVARDTLTTLVEKGFIPSVVITSPDAARGRGMQLQPCETKVFALEHNIPVLTPSVLDDAFLKELNTYNCAYGVAVAYGKIIPQAVINSFAIGIVNVHYSLLPMYRGASPVEMALKNGDEKTGVTIQKMVYELDAGDIVAQEEIAIDANDTTLTLRPKLIALGSDLLVRTLPLLIAGVAEFTPQDAARSTRAPKIRKEEGQLDLSADHLQNWNTYRAFRESPGTHFFAEKEGKRIRVKIINAEFKNGVFNILRIIPEGKNEQDFSYLSNAGWSITH